MKSTPGPWEATPGKIVIGKRVRNGSMDLICDLRSSPYIDEIPYNSLLIAAAPELLEALETLTQSARTFRNVPKEEQEWTSFDDEALENAFKAIAKAEGK